MEPIFHIADQAAWDEAAATGLYAESTRDQTLEQVGFIHCSYRHQVLDIARNFYSDVGAALVLLTIEPDRLDAPVVPEPPSAGAQPFPHIYGALNIGAVSAAVPLRRGDDGEWIFDE